MPAGSQSEIDERRAAVLVGLHPPDLRSLANQAHLGHAGESGEALRFTYDELKQLCVLAASSHL